MKNSADVAIIVLHEIYGINAHIIGVCEQFQHSGYDVICPNIIKIKDPFSYFQEEEAYRYFQENIGFTQAATHVKEIVEDYRTKYKKIILLGFSMGATIAWLNSGDEVKVDGVIGYYGSRIRDYLEIKPKCPTLLIMAKLEKSFDIEKILPVLQRKERVQVHVLNGEHGFADPFSKKYDETVDLKSKRIVSNFLNSEELSINNSFLR